MVAISSLVVASSLLLVANAAPLQKRIAQVIADSTAQWEKACDAAGGGQQCNPVSVASFTTLLAAAGNCDQQNAADNMIDLAKQLNNDPTMIKLAQIFAQQPRNSVRCPLSLFFPVTHLYSLSPTQSLYLIATPPLAIPNLTVSSNVNSKVLTKQPSDRKSVV